MSSKTNLELKHFCNDFSAVRKALLKLGAKKIIVKTQKDYFFHLPQAKLKNNGRLKLRIETNKQEFIYYERPTFKAGTETASKVEVYDVKDKHLLPFLEKSLGTVAIVKKRREVWRKDNTVFHLDIIKNVGNIFEVELQKKGKITGRDKKIFTSYQNALLPLLGTHVEGSNIDLVLKAKS